MISSWKARLETGAEPSAENETPPTDRAPDEDQLTNCQRPEHIRRSEQKGIMAEVICPGLLVPQREAIFPDPSAQLV